MRDFKTTGIILRSNPFNDNDKLITAFSPSEGKITFIAKGARKILSKFTGHLEPLNLCQLELYHSRNWNLLTGCRLQYPYPHHLNNIDKLKSGLYISEVIHLCLPDNQPSLKTYALLKDTLHALTGNPNHKIPIILQYFNIHFLKNLGLLASLSSCNLCGQKITALENYLFEYSHLICPGCYDQNNSLQKINRHKTSSLKNIHLNTLKLIKFFKENPLSSIFKIKCPALALNPIEDLSLRLMENHSGKTIYSLKV